MARLELADVSKVYNDAQGTETAVDDLSLTVADGEFAVLVGPSGCGKSTTLRMIAGLEQVSAGEIRLDGRVVQHEAPARRNVAMVFQNYALYPKMTGRENMEYGLKHAGGMGKEQRQARVQETAELLDIADVVDKYPGQLSGGQKQRVALGRAIVRDPAVFLLDEPLSNLDAKLRSEMRRELQRIHDDLDITTVYVTHDQKEAMTMADRIAVLSDGRLQQVDPPEYAYEHPTNRFVAEFLGSPSMNTVSATVEDGTTLRYADAALGDLPDATLSSYETVTVGIRPEDVSIVAAGEGRIDADVVDVEYQGDTVFVFLDVAGRQFTVRAPRAVRPERGATVGLDVASSALHLFDPETGESLVS
ncbi:MAG: ABC transporter ATP-binding protein [Halobacteriaceae archaeon]